MKTCCPQCDTVLTLTQQQVAQRNGMVRCGVCRHVFNALEHLYEEEDYPVLSEDQDAMYEESPSQSMGMQRSHCYDEENSLQRPRFEGATPSSTATPAVHIHLNTGTETRQSNEPRLFVDQQEQEDEHYIGVRQSNHGERDFTIRSDATYEEEDYYDEPPHRSGFGMFWFILILVAILLIAGQIFYVFRNQISTSFPALRPVLAQMCSLLKCEVGIQKSVDNLALENVLLSVDKNVLPKQGEHALRLQALLSNKTDQAQEWPVLILRLKNAQGVVMNSKNIQPKEYLAPEQVMKLFAANAKQVINLPFILDGGVVTGYELSIFYP